MERTAISPKYPYPPAPVPSPADSGFLLSHQIGGFVSSWNFSPELHDLFATARPVWRAEGLH